MQPVISSVLLSGTILAWGNVRSSSSLASPGLERGRFHELPPSSSILGVSPR